MRERSLENLGINSNLTSAGVTEARLPFPFRLRRRSRSSRVAAREIKTRHTTQKYRLEGSREGAHNFEDSFLLSCRD